MYKIKKTSQIVRYGLVGMLAFAAEYSSFLILISMLSEKNLLIAQTISFCVGLSTSFFGSRLFTFKNKTKAYHHDKKTQFAGYVTLALVNLILANLVIYFLINHLNLAYWIAKIIVMVGVVAWNYAILNRLVFKTI